MRRYLTAVAFAAAAVALSAQTGVVEPGSPLRLAWYHDGAKDARFRLWRNGQIVVNLSADMLEIVAEPELSKCSPGADGAPPKACFTYTTKVGVVPAVAATGKYVYEVSAYNTSPTGATQEAPRSNPLTLLVGWTTPPAQPAGLSPR